jgi:hypothetical protein
MTVKPSSSTKGRRGKPSGIPGVGYYWYGTGVVPKTRTRTRVLGTTDSAQLVVRQQAARAFTETQPARRITPGRPAQRPNAGGSSCTAILRTAGPPARRVCTATPTTSRRTALTASVTAWCPTPARRVTRRSPSTSSTASPATSSTRTRTGSACCGTPAPAAGPSCWWTSRRASRASCRRTSSRTCTAPSSAPASQWTACRRVSRTGRRWRACS